MLTREMEIFDVSFLLISIQLVRLCRNYVLLASSNTLQEEYRRAANGLEICMESVVRTDGWTNGRTDGVQQAHISSAFLWSHTTHHIKHCMPVSIAPLSHSRSLVRLCVLFLFLPLDRIWQLLGFPFGRHEMKRENFLTSTKNSNQTRHAPCFTPRKAPHCTPTAKPLPLHTHTHTFGKVLVK